jgi:copper homeostasis protein
VDVGRCRRMLGLARGKPCTFHKAFDEIEKDEMRAELEVLIELGFISVLTSGGNETAVGGKDVLARLVEAAKRRIDVIVAGKVRSGNIWELREGTGAKWFHSAAMEGRSFDPKEVGALKYRLES